MLVVAQDEISLSKYCMMFSLQPSNAQQLPPLSEIMIITGGASVQYSTKALLILIELRKIDFS